MALQKFLVCVLILAILSQNVSAAKPSNMARVLENLKKTANSTNTQQVSDALNHRLIKLRPTEYPAGLAKANIVEFPWLVTVKADDHHHSCVGVLLSSEWALIPATCGEKLTDKLNGTTKIAAGSSSHFLFRKNNSETIQQVIHHPEFKDNGHDQAVNDIALIKFAKPLTVENQTIKPACLFKSEAESTKPFDNLVVSAFRFENVEDYWVLLKSDFSDQSFHNNTYQLNDLELIKAKGLEHSYCTDKLGGLLNYRNEKNETYVIGINAPTAHCVAADGTNFFTRISHYVKWIKQHVGQALCLKNIIFM